MSKLFAVKMCIGCSQDVAKHEAKLAGLPLLVAAFVLTSHPYPTARRFKFWLEGLRDTQRELRAQASAL